MTFAETALLGAIAGMTIFVGLPVARMKLLSSRTRVGLAMFSVGILVFLLVDVLAHGFEIAEVAVEEYEQGAGSAGEALGYTLLLIAGFGIGCAGLGLVERYVRRRGARLSPIAGGATATLTADDERVLREQRDTATRDALRTGMIVAAAIGLHNFAEGLAIGVSAGTGEIGLATVLIIGFALHNATEGFGIVGPLGDVRPSWLWLVVAGLVAGGPVLLGSMLGYEIDSVPLELAFYALAGGAILYVVGEIWQGMRRFGHREFGLLLITAGFAAGVVTDFIVVYGGG